MNIVVLAYETKGIEISTKYMRKTTRKTEKIEKYQGNEINRDNLNH